MNNSTVGIQGTANFTKNNATSGGAVIAFSSKLYINATVIFFNNSAPYGGAITAEDSDVQLVGDVRFESNFARYGGAIFVVSGSVLISGGISFVSNVAGYGGGIQLESSSQLVLRSPLVASFYDNEASLGGAIFSDDPTSVCSDSRTDCFFTENTDSDQRDVHLNFLKNSAPKGGTAIYGGNLEHCLVNHTTSGISFLQNKSNIISSEISSVPLKVCICENETIADCPDSHEVNVKRGELFSISLIAIGQLNLSVYSGILASRDGPGSVQLSPEHPFSNNTCTNVGIRVFANEDVDQDILQLYPEDRPCVNIAISLKVYLEDCPPGFDLVKDRCDCERRLSEHIDKEKVKITTCDIDSETISRPGNAWIQPIWNHSKYLGFIWHPNCPLGYCKSIQDPIQLNFSNLSTSDSLCTNNHTGMLCGACKHTYSLTLHDYTCRVCENKFLSLLLFFAVSGIY